MTEPRPHPVSRFADRFFPPAVLALAGYVGLWMVARLAGLPVAPELAGGAGLVAGAALGLWLDRGADNRGEGGALPGGGPTDDGDGGDGEGGD